MATTNQIGLALQGLGAGLQGQGPQFQQLMQQRQQQQFEQQQKLDEARRMALLTDNRAGLMHLKAGDPISAEKLYVDRIANIKRLGGDPSDTIDQLYTLREKGPEAAINNAMALDREAVARGYLKPIEDTSMEAERLALEREGLDIRRQQEQRQLAQLDLQRQQEERMSKKMSAPAEKALLDAQDQIILSNRNANLADTLASDYERLNLQGGIDVSFDEAMKKMLGTQDDVTEMRRKFNQIRISEGMRNLPPGPATDKDVEMAMSGMPAANAPAEQVVSFLRGMAKMARFNAGYAQFKSDFISRQGDTRGLNAEWRSSFNSPTLGRSVSVAEIYATAQNRGITPEAVREKLGIGAQ